MTRSARRKASFCFVSTAGGTWNVYQTIGGTQVNANASPVRLTYSASGLQSAVTDAAGGNNPQKVSFGAFYAPPPAAVRPNISTTSTTPRSTASPLP